jgi:hypothetical protein
VERAVGQSVTEVAYGEKVLASMGKELSSWNLESLELLNTATTTFWLVDVFHFCGFVYNKVIDV